MCEETPNIIFEAELDHDLVLRDLHSTQKPARFHHIIGVLQTCVVLGGLYGGNIRQLTASALLHDCAKHFPRETMLDILQARGSLLSEEDLQFPAIWHGPLASIIAEEKYGVSDPVILNAIRHHTLGVPEPDLTLKILMCADYCEPTRTHPGVGDTRNLVRANLDEGLKFVLQSKVNDLSQRGLRPHTRIFETMRSLEI